MIFLFVPSLSWETFIAIHMKFKMSSAESRKHRFNCFFRFNFIRRVEYKEFADKKVDGFWKQFDTNPAIAARAIAIAGGTGSGF